jgi:hypothetical protein
MGVKEARTRLTSIQTMLKAIKLADLPETTGSGNENNVGTEGQKRED